MTIIIISLVAQLIQVIIKYWPEISARLEMMAEYIMNWFQSFPWFNWGVL